MSDWIWTLGNGSCVWACSTAENILDFFSSIICHSENKLSDRVKREQKKRTTDHGTKGTNIQFDIITAPSSLIQTTAAGWRAFQTFSLSSVNKRGKPGRMTSGQAGEGEEESLKQALTSRYFNVIPGPYSGITHSSWYFFTISSSFWSTLAKRLSFKSSQQRIAYYFWHKPTNCTAVNQKTKNKLLLSK